MSYLVIVESPAKAKTIGKYLGSDYKVKASMGHLRDLPRSKLGVDLENGFTPEYKPIKGKEEMIRELKAAAKKSERVFLATDPDREGEAIAWHLKELLELPDDQTFRVTFNEITKKVVVDSIQKPRDLDMDLVDAQQARRILDRIVGYQLSPLLWRKVKRGLSAGRVQSVCTRMIVDRENEIRAFQPEEYWSIEAMLSLPEEGAKPFSARFMGTKNGKLELHSAQEAEAVAAAVREQPFFVQEVKKGQKRRSPAPPFITSTLQQEASRKLGMAARRTMSVAQQLYEGVEIPGQGATGLITYMRTDSQRLSDEALTAVRGYITGRYGKEYCPAKARHYKTRGGAQDAHEAIRPTDVRLTPEDLKPHLNNDQYRLYRLIWSRFVACQMENAVYDTLSIDERSGEYLFRSTSTQVSFPGYTILYVEGTDDEEEKEEGRLPELTAGQELRLRELQPNQHFTQPPARYSEATLVKAMEECGVGRPSTYAPTVSLIQDREYVRKEGKALCPTPLGEVVTGLMKDKFDDIIDVAFTARMEDTLDQVEEGKLPWRSVLENFYGHFSQELSKAEKELEKVSIKIPDEESDVICDLCGRKMVIKYGRFGRFLACPGFPECRNTKALAEETPGECPLCGAQILKKKSKNGYTYYGCSTFPKCGFMTWDVPQADRCPECGKTLFKRQGKGPSKPFCTNEACSLFVPEDQRGYKRRTAKKAGDEETAGAVGGQPEEKKPAAKKTAAKKTAAGKKTAKKPAAKKAPAKKTPKKGENQ